MNHLPDLESIEAIVFDLGEVIIDLNPHAVLKGFQKHTNGMSDNDIEKALLSSSVFLDFETGKVEKQAFINEVNSFLGISLGEDEFRDIWNSMLLPIPQERVLMIEKLRKSHKIYFLSNTNILHQERFDAMIRDAGKYNNLSEMVDHAVYSHLVGMRKPDEMIYRYILDITEKSPKKVLFLDDKEENVLEASKAGIQSFIVENASDLPLKFQHKLA